MARRKRRTRTEALAKRTLIEIKARKRQFLKDVGAILTEALGFTVKVSLATSKLDLSPDQRRAARMTKKASRAQVREAATLAGYGDPPVKKGNIFGDDVGL